MVQSRGSWTSLSKLVWIAVSVILKSGKAGRNGRDTDLETLFLAHKNALQITQKIFPSSPKIYGEDVILPGLITHNSAPTQSPTIFHSLFPRIHLASSFQTNLRYLPFVTIQCSTWNAFSLLSIYNNNWSCSNYVACFWFFWLMLGLLTTSEALF